MMRYIFLFIGLVAFTLNATPLAQIGTLIDTRTEQSSPKIIQDDNTNKFNKNYALVVFFSSTCPHCRRFTPIVKSYTDAHHINIYSYTIDGSGNDAFQNPMIATDDIKQKFYQGMPVVVPAVFVVNVKNLSITSLVVGEESEDDFSHDMTDFIKNIPNE